MKLFHTADLHLGKILHEVSLVDDQRALCDRMITQLCALNPDCLLLAGDIYDRSIPPPEAVSLLDDFFTRLVSEYKKPVIVIAGNHDSPDRLSYASRILKGSNLHIVTEFDPEAPPIMLSDAAGPVAICPLPYVEPALVREKLRDPEIHSQQAAITAALGALRRQVPEGARSVLLAHAFVQGATTSTSERPLSVGTAEAVPADVFEGFHYVALGHLHRPQSFSDGRIRYAGSPLKYSQSEIDHKKSYSLIDLEPDGSIETRELEITPSRDVCRVSGTLEELVSFGSSHPARECYVAVDLVDTSIVFDAAAKLRNIFPYLLTVRPPELPTVSNFTAPSAEQIALNPLRLFEQFVQQVHGTALGEAELEHIKAVAAQIELARREVQ